MKTRINWTLILGVLTAIVAVVFVVMTVVGLFV